MAAAPREAMPHALPLTLSTVVCIPGTSSQDRAKSRPTLVPTTPATSEPFQPLPMLLNHLPQMSLPHPATTVEAIVPTLYSLEYQVSSSPSGLSPSCSERFANKIYVIFK